MNNLADPQKKTSIDQLLNPLTAQDTSYSQVHAQLPSLSASVGQPQAQHTHQGVPGYPTSYGHPSSFNLRAASWEMPEDPTRREDDARRNGAAAPRPYHHPQMNSAPVYGEHHQSPRMTRPGVDSVNGYPMDGRVWHHSPDMHPVPYGPPMIAPMFSDERTALSGDYPMPNNYNHQAYQEASSAPQPPSNSVWQTTERASVRLAARGTMAPPPQEPRYNPIPYYSPSGPYMHGYPPHEPPQPQPPQSQPHESQPSPPSAAQKRSAPEPETEDSTAPKKKAKAKSKSAADGGAGPSRRGYNAKKRSEAAQIAAQNAQLMPAVSYVNDKGKEKATDARMRIVSEDGAQHPEAAGPLHPELQFARCMSNRYRSEHFPRFFLKDNQRNIVGISFVESQKPDAPTMNFPTQWNIPLRPVYIRRTKVTIARALLPTLRSELEHLNIPEIIRRPRESEVRATCDTCMTSIFSSSWMCRLCGREACAECFEQVRDLTIDKPGAGHTEIAMLQLKREKHQHSNPFFLSCTRRNEHTARDFSPMSRFCKMELSQAIEEMEALLKEEDSATATADASGDNSNGTVNTGGGSGSGGSGESAEQAQGHQVANENVVDGTQGPSSTASAPPVEPSATTNSSIAAANPLNQATNQGSSLDDSRFSDTPSHTILRYTDSELTEEAFRPIWTRGEPLVVTGLLPKFSIQWTPEYFIEKYGNQSCLIIECQTDVNKRVTVAEFFSAFGKYDDRKDCWKLKDWPPSTDFKTAFPELYDDFAKAVPVPNYVRRDGVLNIASHFPSNTISPDLGPKMYNAMAFNGSAGSKGTTRLHMDMADALNIMTYASPMPDGSPGCAAWDLFRAEDSDKLRQFLRKRCRGAYQHDPIHSQQFYLNEPMRKELHEVTGVKSFRVYQRPGEAVFIPAGCAHQVVNLADCIKVAVDFVSPENITRCEKLTKEFREQNQSMVWKEDVLQLRTMMWFAWLSCCRQEQD